MLNLGMSRFVHLKLLRAAIRFNSVRSGETYYDVLKLRKDCSNQEIRNAFLQLSKKFHPDVKGITSDPKQTAEFVKISEAYQILSKPKSRSAYDQRLWHATVQRPSTKPDSNMMHDATIHRPWEIHPNYNPEPKPYYGVKGIARTKNWKIAAALTGLCILGAIFGFASVKHSFTFNRQKLDTQSTEAGNYHAAIRADAEKYGNDEQLRRMLHRMMKEDR